MASNAVFSSKYSEHCWVTVQSLSSDKYVALSEGAVLIRGYENVYPNVKRWMLEKRSTSSVRIGSLLVQGLLKTMNAFNAIVKHPMLDLKDTFSFDETVKIMGDFYSGIAKGARIPKSKKNDFRGYGEEDGEAGGDLKRMKSEPDEEESTVDAMDTDKEEIKVDSNESIQTGSADMEEINATPKESIPPKVAKNIEIENGGDETNYNNEDTKNKNMMEFTWNVVSGKCKENSDICSGLIQTFLMQTPFCTVPLAVDKNPMVGLRKQMEVLCAGVTEEKDILNRMVESFARYTTLEDIFGTQVLYSDEHSTMCTSENTIEVFSKSTKATEARTMIPKAALNKALFFRVFKIGPQVLTNQDKVKVMGMCLDHGTVEAVNKTNNFTNLKVFMDKLSNGMQEKQRPGLMEQFRDAPTMARILEVMDDDDGMNKSDSTKVFQLFDLPTIYTHPNNRRKLKSKKDEVTGKFYTWTNFTDVVPLPELLHKDKTFISRIVIGKEPEKYVDKGIIEALMTIETGVNLNDILRSIINRDQDIHQPQHGYSSLGIDDIMKTQVNVVTIQDIKNVFDKQDLVGSFTNPDKYINTNTYAPSGTLIYYDIIGKAFVPYASKTVENDMTFFKSINQHLAQHPVESFNTCSVKSMLSFDMDYINQYKFTESKTLSKINFFDDRVDEGTKALLRHAYKDTNAAAYHTSEGRNTLLEDWLTTCTDYNLTSDNIKEVYVHPQYRKLFLFNDSTSKDGSNSLFMVNFHKERAPKVFQFSPDMFKERTDMVDQFNWTTDSFDASQMLLYPLVKNMPAVIQQACRVSRKNPKTKKFVREYVNVFAEEEYIDGMNGTWFAVFNSNETALEAVDELCNTNFLTDSKQDLKRSKSSWVKEYVKLFKMVFETKAKLSKTTGSCSFISTDSFTCCFIDTLGMVAFVGHSDSTSVIDMGEAYFIYTGAIFDAGLLVYRNKLILVTDELLDAKPDTVTIFPETMNKSFVWPSPSQSDKYISLRYLMTYWMTNNLSADDIQKAVNLVTIARQNYISNCKPSSSPIVMIHVGLVEDDRHVPNSLPNDITLHLRKQAQFTGVCVVTNRDNLLNLMNKRFQ